MVRTTQLSDIVIVVENKSILILSYHIILSCIMSLTDNKYKQNLYCILLLKTDNMIKGFSGDGENRFIYIANNNR